MLFGRRLVRVSKFIKEVNKQLKVYFNIHNDFILYKHIRNMPICLFAYLHSSMLKNNRDVRNGHTM